MHSSRKNNKRAVLLFCVSCSSYSAGRRIVILVAQQLVHGWVVVPAYT